MNSKGTAKKTKRNGKKNEKEPKGTAKETMTNIIKNQDERRCFSLLLVPFHVAFRWF